jgi:hypothetical protein
VAPYYQPVIDLIATHPPPNGSLDLVLKLCQAVEAEHGERIPLLTGQVVKHVHPEMAPPVDIPEEVWYETMARLLFMGEQPHLRALLEWYYSSPLYGRTPREQIGHHWAGIFEFITPPPANLAEKELDRQLGRITTALKILIPEHTSAAKEEVPQPVREVTEAESFDIAAGGSGRVTLSIVLADGIRRLVKAWMVIHQQFLDAGVQELASKRPDRGKKLLSVRERWLKTMGATFADRRFISSPVQQIPIELANIRYGRPPHHRYLDAFPPAEDREFGFTSFDRDPDPEPRGKSAWVSDLLRYRTSQLLRLLDEYGEYYPIGDGRGTTSAAGDERQRKDTYKARRKVIDRVTARNANSLALRTDDDLVGFGCAFHDALLATAGPSPTADDRQRARELLVSFLGTYLTTQTTHTEFNLDEQPTYFDRLFPRAFNGSVLHDCGVYAVRLAFVFLCLADCLKRASADAKPPRVSFVMLPLHVGLIIEIDGFPTLVLHNEYLYPLTDERISGAREEWNASPEPADPTDPEQRRRKFLEDVAAQLFLRDVDLPLIRVPVAPVSAPPKKYEIWKAYQKLVVRNIGQLFSRRIEDSSRPEYQFDLRFLFVLDLERSWYDHTVVPFWNGDCFKLWNRVKATVDLGKRNREQYAKDLEDLIAKVDASYDKEVRPEKEKLTAEFRANPNLLRKPDPLRKDKDPPIAARVTKSSRLKEFALRTGPVGAVRDHVDAVGDPKVPKVPEPPFAHEENFLTRIGE